MKKYHVAAGDGKGYYGVGYESYFEATELLKISQRHDPKAHIVEEEYHFTKADLIRVMSDKEMAKVFSYTQYRAVKDALEQFGVNFECDQQSLEQMANEMLEQLQQPAKEG